MTPSAISHQIKSLEAFLELELFIRHTRRVELTSAGRSYLKAVQKALGLIERATQRLLSEHGSGELKLAVAPAFLSRWLLPRMSQFYEEHPNIELDIAASTGLIDFAHSDTDMAVYFGNGEWEDVTSHFLKSSVLVPVCAPDLLQRHPINTAEDLGWHTLLHVSKRPEEWEYWFEAAGVPFVERRKGMALSSSLLTARAAAKGLGVALADVNLVTDEIESGQLVIPLDITLSMGKAFYLVYEEDRPVTYAMREFRDWIMAAMARDALSASAEAQ